MDEPSVKCSICNQIHVIEVPWARKSCRFTHQYEQKTVAYAAEMRNTVVSKTLGESNKVVANHVHYAVEEALKYQNFEGTTKLGIDETSKAKGHNYISIGIDMDIGKVILIADGKGSSVLYDFSDQLIVKGGNPLGIEEIVMDMSPSFISGAALYFPNAAICFDKFHVIKMLNEFIDEIRRKEAREIPILRGTKYIWLYNPENLSERQAEQLKKLSKQRLKTARAYRYKLALQHIYQTCKGKDAETELLHLISWGMRSRIPELQKFARTLKNHFEGVLRYFESGLTSGVVEGTNRKIQEVKRRSRGFPNLQHFKNMIFLVAGNLQIPRLYGTGEPVVM
jgi:transposase